jgi:integrase
MTCYHPSTASVVRKPTSRFWFAAFRDEHRRQRRISTGQIDKARALKIAEKFELAAKRKGDPQRVLEAFANIYREFYGTDLPSSSVRRYCERWLEGKKRETALSTFLNYNKAVRKLLAFLGPAADRDLSLVTKEALVRFRNAVAEQFSPGTVNLDLVVVRMIFRSARIAGYLVEDPAEGLRPIRDREQTKRRPFTLLEIQRILEAADPEWRSLVLFGLYTGQRLGDIATLTWDNVDLERGELRLVARKTGKRLVIPLAEPLRKHLESLPAGDVPGAPLHPRAFAALTRSKGQVAILSSQFSQLLAQAGFKLETPLFGAGRRRAASELSFHNLRHTAVSLLKDAGVPDAAVMELVGHNSRAMSQRYTHVGVEALSMAVNALPKL